MTIVDEDVERAAADDLARPWWFIPALLGIALGAIVGVVLVPGPASTTASLGASADQPHQAVVSRSASPTVATRPSDLPLFPREQDVTSAMSAIFVTATAVGYSSFDDALGAAWPARVFSLGDGRAADVLFLDEVPDVHVCATATPRGLVYRVTVDGRETRNIEAARPIAFLYGRGLFVIAWDDRAEVLFERALSIARAPC